MGLEEEISYWQRFSEAMGNADYRDRFFKILKQTVEEDNALIAREGLQNPTVNHLHKLEGQNEPTDS